MALPITFLSKHATKRNQAQSAVVGAASWYKEIYVANKAHARARAQAAV
jgi:hypothetical protein